MLKAERSRRIMFKSAEAIIVRCWRDNFDFQGRKRQALYARMAGRGMRWRNSPSKHDVDARILYRYSLGQGSNRTNKVPIHPPCNKNHKRSRQKLALQAIDANAVGIGKCDPFMDNHWDNAGSSRIVGQECDEIGLTNKNISSKDGTGRSSLLFIWFVVERSKSNKILKKGLNQNDKREGGCSRKSMKSRSEPGNGAEGVWS